MPRPHPGLLYFRANLRHGEVSGEKPASPACETETTRENKRFEVRAERDSEAELDDHGVATAFAAVPAGGPVLASSVSGEVSGEKPARATCDTETTKR